QRVSSVFENANGMRGDMQAVVKAILLDPEARSGDTSSGSPVAERLREPVQFIAAVLRNMSATVATANGLPQIAANLGQNPFYPPTVFNYYAPDYEIGGTKLNAPEFGIYSP